MSFAFGPESRRGEEAKFRNRRSRQQPSEGAQRRVQPRVGRVREREGKRKSKKFLEFTRRNCVTGTYGFSDRKWRFKDRLTTSSADETLCVGSRPRKASFACVFVSLLLGSKRNRDSTWTRILLGCLVVGNLFSFPRASFVHGLIYRDPKDTAFFGHRPSCRLCCCSRSPGKKRCFNREGSENF